MANNNVEGSRAPFPETVWSTILLDPDSPDSREKLNGLFTRYWRPVYSYIQGARAKSREDAMDLTQGFFQHLLEQGVVAKYQRDRGRFRDFLKGTLRFFLSHEYRDSVRQKRGGGAPVVSLDLESLETSEFLSDIRQRPPDELFDKQWAEEVLRQGIIRLKETLTAEGKALYFQVYEAYDLCPSDREAPTYVQIAESLGLKNHDVENYLNHSRARLRAIVRDSISDYVTSEEELIKELKDLFST